MRCNVSVRPSVCEGEGEDGPPPAVEEETGCVVAGELTLIAGAAEQPPTDTWKWFSRLNLSRIMKLFNYTHTRFMM